ncbi:uncharacterized protein [Lepeophtheirus salmonis]|uniref:uncharacterized protein n=1 Tax=Lepeophtheirus salmonis TaxID=72036 RepID=UPI001AE38682|nr:uncharacterized protein LOC121118074 [Lepeophtheirus salmonis]
MSVSGTQESYKLRWGEFHGNLISSLEELRGAEDLVDVTLIVDEDRAVSAHKVILSASSPYFRKIFKRNQKPNLELMLPQHARLEDVVSLLEFMYTGEVSVNKDEMDSFMALAKLLKVKGLTQDYDSNERPPPSKMPKFPPEIQSNRQRGMVAPMVNKRPRTKQEGNSSFRGIEDEIHNDHQSSMDGGQNEYYEDFNSSRDEFYPEESKLVHRPNATGTQLICVICPNCRCKCQNVQALKDHMANSCNASSTQSSVPFNSTSDSNNVDYQNENVICNICDKTFKNHKSMLAHRKRLHKVGVADEPTANMNTELVSMNPSMVKKRGRPSKKTQPVPSVNDESLEEETDYSESVSPQSVVSQSSSKMLVGETSIIRPVVQVSPAPRPQGSHTTQAHLTKDPSKISEDNVLVRQNSPRGDNMQNTINSPLHQIQQVRPPLHSVGIPRGPQRLNNPSNFRKNPQHPNARNRQVGGRNMDLQKIGMKLGGQISITSSDNDPPGASTNMGVPIPNPNKLTITKLKGDNPIGSPLSIKEATQRRSQNEYNNQQQPTVEVKEEPTEHYGEDNSEQQFSNNSYDDTSQENYDEIAGDEEVPTGGEGLYEEGYENTDEDMEDERQYIPTSHINRRYNHSPGNSNSFTNNDAFEDVENKMQ